VGKSVVKGLLGRCGAEHVILKWIVREQVINGSPSCPKVKVIRGVKCFGSTNETYGAELFF
jgi:hypothetical protein